VSAGGISARDLYGVVLHLVATATEFEEPLTSHERFKALAEFAGEHDLTLPEFITVLRVAAGEKPEDSTK